MNTCSSHRSRKPRAFINHSALVWAETVRGLPTGPNSLLQFLARKSDEFGCSYYGKKALAERLGCSPRSVQTYVRTLEGYGLIRSIGRRGPDGQITSVYHVMGWMGRNRLPISGHPKLGRYIVEPGYTDFRDALCKQELLGGQENSAPHKSYIESGTTLDEEGAVERCITELGAWITAREQDMLRDDYLSLFHLMEHGYGLEAHILPVLRIKAQTRRKARLIRTWDYFGEAIAEYATGINKDLERAFRKDAHLKVVRTDPKDDQDRAALQRIYNSLKRTPPDTGSDGGPE